MCKDTIYFLIITKMMSYFAIVRLIIYNNDALTTL